MTKHIFEIVGKDGTIQIGEDWSLSGNEVGNYFSYKNKDIVYIYKEILDDTPWTFFSFKEDLRGLLSNSSYFRAMETLRRKPDSWFKKLLKINLWFDFFPEEIQHHCEFLFQNPYGVVKIKKNKNSLDYIIEFEMPDPYPMDISDDDEILFKGSLLVSEEALVNFYQQLKY